MDNYSLINSDLTQTRKAPQDHFPGAVAVLVCGTHLRIKLSGEHRSLGRED